LPPIRHPCSRRANQTRLKFVSQWLSNFLSSPSQIQSGDVVSQMKQRCKIFSFLQENIFSSGNEDGEFYKYCFSFYYFQSSEKRPLNDQGARSNVSSKRLKGVGRQIR
jgi:hypothetical protein